MTSQTMRRERIAQQKPDVNVMTAELPLSPEAGQTPLPVDVPEKVDVPSTE